MKVGELFAGVGGFRVALEPLGFEFAWANQWEPKAKVQVAAQLYREHFGDVLNEDVHTLDPKALEPVDLLVGGFPCQNYSAAVPLAYSMGLEGEKGALWWQVERFALALRPRYLLLENVDRLLLSPAHERGSDFARILVSLAGAGYSCEWRVINAADYGFPQKRRRVFILARRGSEASGTLARAFPGAPMAGSRGRVSRFRLGVTVGRHDFETAGTMSMIVGDAPIVETWRFDPAREPARTLASVLERDVAGRYVIPPERVDRWRYLKGAKDEPREAKTTGHAYQYKEGALSFPDKSDAPSRTLLTSEGSLSPSRTAHVVADPGSGALRILTPVEAERLMGFPDGWTASAPERFRYFAMGNALVVGVVRRIGEQMLKEGLA